MSGESGGYLTRAILAKSGGALSSEGSEHMKSRALMEAEATVLRKEQGNLTAAIISGVPLPGLKEKAQDLADRIYLLDIQVQTIEVQLYLLNHGPIEDVIVDEVLEYLYVAGDREKEQLANLHLKLVQLIECVWVWAYDVALVKLKAEDDLLVVQLMHKQLPSRANPGSKYHKQSPKREIPEKPYHELAAVEKLVPPEPRTVATRSKSAQYK